jgi:hypothetical protein
VRYAVEGALGSVIADANADDEGTEGTEGAEGATDVLSPLSPGVGLAVAIDHDHPMAIARTNTVERTLKVRSLREESPAR